MHVQQNWCAPQMVKAYAYGFGIHSRIQIFLHTGKVCLTSDLELIDEEECRATSTCKFTNDKDLRP